MKRNKIALIGGGQIGGILALICGQKELGDVVIVDVPKSEGMVKGKALDIIESNPHDGYDVKITGSSKLSDIKDANVVAITAGVPRKPGMSREDLLEINVNIISNIANNVKKYCPNAFVIVVSNPLDAIVYAFHRISGLPKNQVVGMAGALDNARFKAFIAMETGLSVQDISCIVLGGHGPTMIPLISSASIGGVPLLDILDNTQINKIVNRVQHAGTELVQLYGNGSAFFSPATAIVEMIEANIKDKKRVIPSAALCEGEYGINNLFIGVPTVIGKDGIEKRFNPTLIGKSGQREIEVNSYGRVIREISRQDSQKGNDIQITIDLRIQQYALNLLKEHKAGSAVLMDINNGNVLCMASTPSYDPNKIIQKPNKEYWDSILENELSPLTYRLSLIHI